MIRIRLTRKLAPTMNGVDVSRANVGDILELGEKEAATLIENGWAEAVPPVTPLAHPDNSRRDTLSRRITAR
jgi:hypothetical protein